MAMPTFINVDFSKAARVMFEAELTEGLEFEEMVTKLLDDGAKTSFGYDADQGTYACYITGMKNSKNAGFCIGQRAGSLYEALNRCYVIHTYVAPGKDWSMAKHELEAVMENILRQIRDAK